MVQVFLHGMLHIYIPDGEKDRGTVHKPKHLISIANGCFFVAHEFSLDGLDLLLKLAHRFFHNPSSPCREVIRDALLWKLPPAKVADGVYRMVGFKVFQN